jgi:hypothetical protein
MRQGANVAGDACVGYRRCSAWVGGTSMFVLDGQGHGEGRDCMTAAMFTCVDAVPSTRKMINVC